ncbi:unnamed protein product, partial [Mesorhabditis spiculigera]
MAEPKVALQISPPQELVFQGPFTDVVTSPLRLMNRGTQPICFKVKTTAPKQYCVRPNSGIVAPGHTFETLGTQEETPASIKYIQNSTTKSVHHTPPGIQTSSHVTNLRSGNDDEFARMQQKAQKAENELTAVRKDLDDIMKAILITVAGLLIGLILGKLM